MVSLCDDNIGYSVISTFKHRNPSQPPQFVGIHLVLPQTILLEHLLPNIHKMHIYNHKLYIRVSALSPEILALSFFII